jgi:hypothetical protein
MDAMANKQTGATTVKTKGEREQKGSPRSRYLTGDPEQERQLREGFVVASQSGENKPGATLLTRNHDIIMHWAEARGAQPATVPGTEHEGRPGVLRFDFPGYGGRELQHISWDEWFHTFETRDLAFVYQETTRDGTQSNFFRFDNPHREEA